MINTCTLMGRLVADPTLHVSEFSGKEVTTFAIATPRPGTDADGNKVADFFDVVAWGQTAKFICDHFLKGDTIAVDGKLRTRTYTDRNGARRRVVEVWANEVAFGEKRRDRHAD